MYAFYGSRISEHLSRTPEGYLVATGVPIARTGWQQYLSSEIGLPGNAIVQVWRDPEDVFSSETIASGEGKAVCDGHPPTNVTAENHSAFDRGHGQNVRRGQVEGDVEPLLADLVITDPTLIHKIDSGVREISCGYSCDYEPMPDQPGCYRQRNIRINHIAVVPNGRAGAEVRIRDEQPAAIAAITAAPAVKSKEKKPMSKAQTNQNLIGRVLKAFAATDAEPEEVAEAAKLASKSEERSERATTDTPAEQDPESPKGLGEHLNRVVDALAAHGKIMADHAATMKTMNDSMEALHKTIKGEGGENKDGDPDMIQADAELTPTVVPAGDRPENPVADAALVDHLRKLKPAIAATKDQAAIDNFNTAMAAAKGITRPAPGTPGYAALLAQKKPQAVLDAERSQQQQQAGPGVEAPESRASFFDNLRSSLGKSTPNVNGKEKVN